MLQHSVNSPLDLRLFLNWRLPTSQNMPSRKLLETTDQTMTLFLRRVESV